MNKIKYECSKNKNWFHINFYIKFQKVNTILTTFSLWKIYYRIYLIKLSIFLFYEMIGVLKYYSIKSLSLVYTRVLRNNIYPMNYSIPFRQEAPLGRVLTVFVSDENYDAYGGSSVMHTNHWLLFCIRARHREFPPGSLSFTCISSG